MGGDAVEACEYRCPCFNVRPCMDAERLNYVACVFGKMTVRMNTRLSSFAVARTNVELAGCKSELCTC